MAVKKSELYRSLWASCDELRGSMDASQYKDYVLVLLFMKYVSDRKDPLVELAKGSTFYDMLQWRGQNCIGDEMNKVVGEFTKNNNLQIEIDFNDDTKLGSGKDKIDRLTNLLNIFNRPELSFSSNRAEGDDLLGDAYEYLMRHFATESGKSKGQFYTPAEVSRVMAEVVGVRQAKSSMESIYDPTCGSGSLLLKAAAIAPYQLSIYGQENDNTTRGLAVMNMWLHNFTDANIELGNTLAAPQFTNEATGELKTFEYAVANPPFSYKSWMNGLDPLNDPFERFDIVATAPPKKNGDYAFLLHIIKSLKMRGKACVVLPLGVLFRGNAEGEIRKALIKKGYIKGIIGLPPNLFYGTNIAASLIVVDKEQADQRTHIFMVDASRGFAKDGNKNRLREQDIHKMVDAFTKCLELPRYSRNVPVAEIASAKNDYNLNIPRYIDSQEAEDIQDIEAHLLGGIPKRDIDALADYWAVYPTLKQHLFEPLPDRPNYCRLRIEPATTKDSIYNHPEFTAFGQQMDEVFARWRTWAVDYARTFEQGLHPKQAVHRLSEKLLRRYADKPLTDAYAMYQHLMDYWADTMQDDCYELAADGWAAGNGVKRLVKKTKKGDREIAKDVPGLDGLEGRLIPPRLLIAGYFAAEQAHIDELEVKLETISGEKTELLDEHGLEEGALQGVSSKKEADVALREQVVLAMGELYPAEFARHTAYSHELAVLTHFLQEQTKEPALVAMQTDRVKLTPTNVTARMKQATDLIDIASLERYVGALKEKTKLTKAIDKLIETVLGDIKASIGNPPGAELADVATVLRFIDLLEAEADTKAALKRAYDELEAKVIAKYPQLTTDEIKMVVIERKWMAAMEQRIRTEMDNISHRLTQRIRDLADRYETPLPALESEVDRLEQRVKEHLLAMGFAA